MASPEPPPCQAYLVVPPETAPETLAGLLDSAAVACVLIRRGGLDPAALRTQVQGLCPVAQARGVAVLLEDEAALAAALGCDGVHVSDPAAYKTARQVLGPDAIVGVACGGSHHDAMVAGENGADYVAFGGLDPPQAPEADLVGWWQALTTVPSVAFGAQTPEEAGDLARAGADFVALGPEIWDQGEAGPAALRAAVAAFAQA